MPSQLTGLALAKLQDIPVGDNDMIAENKVSPELRRGCLDEMFTSRRFVHL
jgi:hypothetical protein